MSEPEPIDIEYEEFCTEQANHHDIMHTFNLMLTKMNKMENEIQRMSRVIDNQAWVHERLTDALIELLNKNDDDVYMEQ